MYMGGAYVGDKVRHLETRPHLVTSSRVNMSYTTSPISPFVACSLSIISLEIPVSHCGEHVDVNLHGHRSLQTKLTNVPPFSKR
jgi:hypothetical protein